MQSVRLASCVSGQSPGEAALFSSPWGCRLTKEKDWCWYQHSFHRFVLLRMPALAVWEREKDNDLLCIWQNGNEGRKDGYVQILHNISHSSVMLSICWSFRACKAAWLWWLLKVNPWKTACASPQAYSRLPPVVSAAAPLSACSRCGQHKIPEAWDYGNNVSSSHTPRYAVIGTFVA